MTAPEDATRRFGPRTGVYARHRPGYPGSLLAALRARGMIRPGDEIADIGCGTGLLARLFLEAGHSVVGVEPEGRMRAEGRRLLASHPGFLARDGRAEATGLAAACVDVVAAGQAFHWFDPAAAREEFRRILRPGGRAVLVWNDRRTEDSSFMGAYEALLASHGRDYHEVEGRRTAREELDRFLGPAHVEVGVDHEQVLDAEGLEGRIVSASYMPGPGDPGHPPLREAVARLFAEHQQEGEVRMLYRARAHAAVLNPL